jgi:hypothetical protein
MKYTSQRNRLAAVEALLGPRHQVLRIIGGLPQDAQAPPPPLSSADHPESADQPLRQPPGTTE